MIVLKNEHEEDCVQLEKVEEKQCLRLIEEAICEQCLAITELHANEELYRKVEYAVSEVLDTYGCGIIANADSLRE